MGRIVAIGGGEIGRPGRPVETERIDRAIIALTGKAKPRLCFLPTASLDAGSYIDAVREHFGSRLGCEVTPIELVRRRYARAELEEIVLSSDIVYAGGGDTQAMLEAWIKLSFDRVLLKAYERNIVLSGVSAGAVCWFKYGSADSLPAAEARPPAPGIPGLNLIELALCPHFDSEKYRRPGFRLLLQETGTRGIGLDDCAALKIADGRFEIIASRAGARAWHCGWSNGEYIETALDDGAAGDSGSLMSL